MTGRHVFYEGRVQGIGFRYSTKRLATGFEVLGWVKNLDDSRVELRITGDAEEVDAFLQAIRDSELGAHLRTENVTNVPPQVGVKGFEIVH